MFERLWATGEKFSTLDVAVECVLSGFGMAGGGKGAEHPGFPGGFAGSQVVATSDVEIVV